MSWHPRSTYHPDDRTWVADEGRELPLPTSLRQKPGLSGSVDTPDGGRARANGLPVQGAATLLGCLPSKEPQRRNGGPVARALRVVSKRPRYGVALLAKGSTLCSVARLVAEPFGRNAIPRRECQQTLAATSFHPVREVSHEKAFAQDPVRTSRHRPDPRGDRRCRLARIRREAEAPG